MRVVISVATAGDSLFRGEMSLISRSNRTSLKGRKGLLLSPTRATLAELDIKNEVQTCVRKAGINAKGD